MENYIARIVINAFVILIVESTQYFSLAAMFNLDISPSMENIFIIFSLYMICVLTSHYVTWWNAYLDTAPGPHLEMRKSMNSQSVGAVLAIFLKCFLMLPALSSTGVIGGIFNGMIVGALGCLFGCDIGIICLISLYKRLIRTNILGEDQNRFEESHTKFNMKSITSILGNSISMLCFSFFSLMPGIALVDPAEPQIIELLVLCLFILIVSYLCLRYILRRSQLRDALFHKDVGWDQMLNRAIYSSILNILLTAFFPIAQLLSIASLKKETILVGSSLFWTLLGTLCFLGYYKWSQKKVSWTGIKIMPDKPEVKS